MYILIYIFKALLGCDRSSACYIVCVCACAREKERERERERERKRERERERESIAWVRSVFSLLHRPNTMWQRLCRALIEPLTGP
jgi:hypothetical protein